MVLIEDKNDAEAITALGQRNLPCQEAFAKFLTGLFHWKLDTSESRTYSLKPDDYPRLPLFTSSPEKCVVLNQVFWLVFDDSLSWQSMLCLSCDTAEEVEQLADSQYLSITASRSGSALLKDGCPSTPFHSSDDEPETPYDLPWSCSCQRKFYYMI